MKLLTLSKKTVSIFQPIIQVGNTKLGPLPLNLESILEKLKSGSKFENDTLRDQKLLDQLKDAGFVTVTDDVYTSTSKLTDNIRKELLELFNSKIRVENAIAAPVKKTTKVKPKPSKASKPAKKIKKISQSIKKSKPATTEAVIA